jgi:hypothetical protein
MMDMKEGDRVASIARIPTAELKQIGANINGDSATETGAQFEMPLK